MRLHESVVIKGEEKGHEKKLISQADYLACSGNDIFFSSPHQNKIPTAALETDQKEIEALRLKLKTAEIIFEKKGQIYKKNRKLKIAAISKKVWITRDLIREIISFFPLAHYIYFQMINKFWRNEMRKLVVDLQNKFRIKEDYTLLHQQDSFSLSQWMLTLIYCCKISRNLPLSVPNFRSNIFLHFWEHDIESLGLFKGYTEWLVLYARSCNFTIPLSAQQKLTDQNTIFHSISLLDLNLTLILMYLKIYPNHNIIQYFFKTFNFDKKSREIANVFVKWKNELRLTLNDLFYFFKNSGNKSWMNWLCEETEFNPFVALSLINQNSAIEEYPFWFRKNLYELGLKFHIQFQFKIRLFENKPKILLIWEEKRVSSVCINHFCIIPKEFGE